MLVIATISSAIYNSVIRHREVKVQVTHKDEFRLMTGKESVEMCMESHCKEEIIC